MTRHPPPAETSPRREDVSGLSAMLTFLSCVVVVAILYFAREIVVPLTLAVLLSFLLGPVVRRLHRRRVGRVTAVLLTVAIAFVAILGFVATVAQEVSSLAGDLPGYRYNLEAKIRSLPELLPDRGVFHRVTTLLGELQNELAQTTASPPENAPASAAAEPAKPLPVQLQEPPPRPWQVVQTVVGPLIDPLATGGLVIVFVIMFLLQQEHLRDRLLRLGGRRDLHRTTEAINDAAQRISRYLSRQSMVNLACGLPIGIGLAVIGIPNAALWGIFVVLLRFVPYLGIVVAASFPLALAVAVAPGWALFGWTLLLFVAVETVVSYVVEPWFYGAGTGLSPVALIAAATFWTWLWGPIGLLLATPLTVCLVVLGRHVPQLQFLDVVLGDAPALTPPETFYQRLLADDPEEATEQAEEFAGERSFEAFFDEVALPSLARAQADSDRGALVAGHRAMLRDGIETVLENLGDNGDAAPPTEPHLAVVLCVAGRNELDEAAALLLADLLRRHGVAAASMSAAEGFAAGIGASPTARGSRVMVLSLVSTAAPARARYLVRRLRRRSPGATVLVGFWGVTVTGLDPADAAAASAADGACLSLQEALAAILPLTLSAGEAARPAAAAASRH
jgi:predicted PurR-regulated permease PerM